ncbi:MAG: hypothetical protein KDC52_04285 [Ignavibacteriae bacterium]|nr:hypothetical protein [Ignavibacteriota bacterium]MCB9248609.1 hypothetical protein [Ignavibacteriales bacterium]
MFNKIIKSIKSKINIADEIAKSKSVDILESEITQLETVFSTLVFGNFVGIPTTPIQITFDLLAESEKSIEFLINRINTQTEPLSELASIFRID